MRKLSLLFVLLIALNSCSEATRKARPLSTGKLGEIFVILDDKYDTDRIRHDVKVALKQIQPRYGASEPYFKVIFMSPSMARGSLLYEGVILFIAEPSEKSDILRLLPDKLDQTVLRQKGKSLVSFAHKDLWAAPQRLFFLVSSDEQEVHTFLNEKGDILRDRLLKLEMEEAEERMTYLPDEKISKEIKEMHGITLMAPTSFHIASNAKLNDEEGLVWLREAGESTDLNIVVHYQPYTDTTQFQLKQLIARRDTVVRPIITGEAPNSYMATDTQFQFHLETFKFKDHFAKAYDGYWTMQNDFMGGPYYAMTVLDEEKQRLITIEGFVYAPKHDKTEYMRSLIGIIHGVSF